MARLFVVVGVAVFALVLSGNALALDHVTIKTHDIQLSKRAAKKKLPPFCKKGQKSTKRHPCRKRPRHTAAATTLQNPPDAGWLFGLNLGQNSDGTWGLTVGLKRTVGSALEYHNYSFTLGASSVTVAPDLSSTTLDTGTQLGQFGSMKLTFSNVGALANSTPATGCTTGTWQTRTGTMTGQVTFVADNTYFQTIVQTSLPTDVSANTGDPPTCTFPAPSCFHQTSLGVLNPPAPFFFAANGGAGGGPVSLYEFFTQTVAPARITHFLSESNLPAGDLTVAPDLSSASVATTGATRFTGSLNFTASAQAVSNPYPACSSTSTTAQGTTTGGITGHFLAIPVPAPVLGPSFVTRALAPATGLQDGRSSRHAGRRLPIPHIVRACQLSRP